MMKRILAALCGLLLFAGCALAQEGSIASYDLPVGAEVRYLTEASLLDVPSGLQPMYDLMQNAVLVGDVYLIRMPNGRALASVSSTPVDTPRTAEELLQMWPQIAQSIALEVTSIDDSADCARLRMRQGVETLHISTDITVGENVVTLLKAEGYAFCQQDRMVEVWAVWPDEPMYLYDEQAASELSDDLVSLKQFLDSLNFSSGLVTMTGYDYTEPNGRFTLRVPEGFVLVTPDTAAEEVASVRERFISANAQGADKLFDYLLSDVNEQHMILLLTGDMKGAVSVFCENDPDFEPFTPDLLANLAEPIRQMLVNKFGVAILLSNTGRVTMSGAESALMGYWLRSGECNLQLDVVACVQGQSLLCEADLYVMDGDQNVRALLSSLISQTLIFHAD